MPNITMRQMLESGVHFGHQTRYWNPKMGTYIFGIRHGIHIINLEYSLPLYRESLNFVMNLAANRGKVLFVGTKQAAQEIIREEATRCKMPYVDYRWLGGMLTNYKTIRQSIKRLKELLEMRDSGMMENLTKKEAITMQREINKLEMSLGGIKDMGGLPDALFVVDVGHEKIAISEAKRLGIPVIGIVDTNNSPDGIGYMIPGNDDSVRAIRLYAQGIADAILEARSQQPEAIEIVEVQEEEVSDTEKNQPKRRVMAKKPAHKAEGEVAEHEKEAAHEGKVTEKPAKSVEVSADDKTEAAEKSAAKKHHPAKKTIKPDVKEK